MIRFDDEARTLALSVRDVAALGHRGGDLVMGGAAPGGARLQIGAREHRDWQAVSSGISESFRAEVSVAWEREIAGWQCRVYGRIDGVLATERETLVQELKTVQLENAALAEAPEDGWPTWRMQLSVYLFLLHQQQPPPAEDDEEPPPRLRGELILRSIVDGSQRRIAVVPTPVATEALIVGLVEQLIEEREEGLERTRWRAEQTIPFPFAGFRPGQREMVEELTTGLEAGQQVMFSAPTGAGKTAAALTAALRVASRKGLRIFYVTARGSNQRGVMETLRRMGGRFTPTGGRPEIHQLRGLQIRAREKACVRAEGPLCRPDACERAAGYYTRLFAERADRKAWQGGVVDAPQLATIAEQDQLCPYELTLDSLPGVDVIVCDYNYVFGPRQALRRFFGAGCRWDDALLIVDEAHNLPRRARESLSPELSQGLFDAVELGMAQGTVPDLDALREVVEEGQALFAGIGALLRGRSRRERTLQIELDPTPWVRILQLLDELLQDRALYSQLAKARRAQRQSSFLAGEQASDPVMDLFMALRPFVEVLSGPAHPRLALETGDEESPEGEEAPEAAAAAPALPLPEPAAPVSPLPDLRQPDPVGPPAAARALAARHPFAHLWIRGRRRGESPTLKLLCKDPSQPLGERIGGFAASMFISATLRPNRFFGDLMGLVEEKVLVSEHPGYFDPAHRAVVVHPLSTRYRDRERTAPAIAQVVLDTVDADEGVWLVFASSFRYLDQLRAHLLFDEERVEVLVQPPQLQEAPREALLDELRRPLDPERPRRVLLGVLGGSFSEAIDLPGHLLRGVMVLGPALPGYGLETELIKEHYQERYRKGFDYAYVFPGMSRVVQAAGRVIRAPEDQAAVVLVGSRFRQRNYQALFPWSWRGASWLQPDQLAEWLQTHPRPTAATEPA